MQNNTVLRDIYLHFKEIYKNPESIAITSSGKGTHLGQVTKRNVSVSMFISHTAWRDQEYTFIFNFYIKK